MAVTDNIVETRIAKTFGHFGEWLQGRVGTKGPVALISVQCPQFWVRVSRKKSESFQYADVLPCLPRDAMKALFAALQQPHTGVFTVSSNMQFGAGLGASTASLLAAARTIADFGVQTDALAKSIVAVEGASDPLMYDAFDRLLWASRKAEILDRFAAPPLFTVLGGMWGARQKTNPNDQNFADISDLLKAWQTATSAKDHAKTAEIATESFRRTSELRHGGDDPTLGIARDVKALGVIRAHTGSARGFLFKSDAAAQSGLNLLAEAGYSGVTTFQTGGTL